MKRFKSAVLVTFIASALTGCFGNDKIKEVKALTFDNIDSTNTLGNALDTRKMCKETNWTQGKDDRKREVVSYTCEMTGFEVFFSQWNDAAVEEIANENKPKLEQLRRDLAATKVAKKQNAYYFAFVEKMAKQNVIPALALVKKNSPSITNISNVASDQTEDHAKAAGVSDESLASFMAASKLYSNALNSNEFGKDFVLVFVDRYMHSFEEIIDGVNRGRTVEAILDMQKKEDYDSDKAIAEAKEKLEAIEKLTSVDGLEKVRQSWEVNQPVRITQRVVFATSGATPKLLSCGFEFYTPNSKSVVAYRRKIDNDTTCLKASYQSDYSQYYMDMIKKVFIVQKERK